jgi:transmembrane sensor
MADIVSRLAELKQQVQPNWGPDRERRVRARVERSLLSRRRRRGALVVALAAVVSLVVVLVGQRWTSEPALPVEATVAPRAPQPLLHFADGSEVVARSSNARLEPVVSSADEITLRLDSGSARFSVTPNAERVFRVLAGSVTVQVLGTVFTVTREAERVLVSVERGRVWVMSPLGDRELGVGESGQFSEARSVEPSLAPLPLPLPLPATSAAPAPPAPRPVSPWRALAQDGNYAAALAEIDREGPKAVRDLPEELLLAADAARLGGRPDRAVSFLERLVKRFPRDARAPLAAFTLGRTLLDQLGRPREAAQAFASARRLDSKGAMAEDALAREVEAWSRAGETELARERARDFLTRYPKGRRAAAVRRLGGVD